MAGKKNKDNLFVRIGKSIILRLKEELEFADIKIMTHVLTVVLMISIIAATVAWFALNVSASIKSLYLSTSNADPIQMSLADGGEWIDVLGDHYHTDVTHGVTDGALNVVDISMPAFENIYNQDSELITDANSSILAPGTYGSFSFYLKSVNTEFKSCELSIAKVLDSVIEGNETLTEEVNRLFDGHILCFAQVGESADYQYVSMDNPITVSFSDYQKGESASQKVIIYWVWPYEYKDLSADTFYLNKDITIGTDDEPASLFRIETVYDCLNSGVGNEAEDNYLLSANQIFEWEYYNDTVADYKKAVQEKDNSRKEELLSEWYDYADTLIGSYVENMSFHIQVKGVKSDGNS